jgi:hypothetical protein
MPPERINPQTLPTVPGGEMGNPKGKIGPAVSAPPKINAFSTSTVKPMKTVIHGEVVANDQQTPRSGAKLVFVNALDLNQREYVTADEFGGFDTKLPAGDWHMYVDNGKGEASYHKKLTIKEGESRNFTVVSR